MGLLKFLTKVQEDLNKTQEKITDFQNKVNTFNSKAAENPVEAFKTLMPKPKDAESKQSKTAKPIKHTPKKPDATTQILAQRDSMIKNGFDEYEFIANSGCCEVCGKLNGKHFPISKFEIGVNAPPMHEGCRCSIAAYSDREEYEKWLNRF